MITIRWSAGSEIIKLTNSEKLCPADSQLEYLKGQVAMYILLFSDRYLWFSFTGKHESQETHILTYFTPWCIVKKEQNL